MVAVRSCLVVDVETVIGPAIPITPSAPILTPGPIRRGVGVCGPVVSSCWARCSGFSQSCAATIFGLTSSCLVYAYRSSDSENANEFRGLHKTAVGDMRRQRTAVGY